MMCPAVAVGEWGEGCQVVVVVTGSLVVDTENQIVLEMLVVAVVGNQAATLVAAGTENLVLLAFVVAMSFADRGFGVWYVLGA